jgi:hypothetical protein
MKEKLYIMDIENGANILSVLHNDNSSNNISNIVDDRNINGGNINSSSESFSNISTHTDSNIKTINDVNINIYRYKFSPEFTDELYKFSKIHQYEHRHDFKESWAKWREENLILINEESRRLINLGYDRDIMDKMFKSARYYFRKKSTEKKEPAKRRTYISTQKELIEAMDEHINKNIYSENFKPSEGFDDFCKNQKELIKQEVIKLIKEGITDKDELKIKIKKTYKNRYFIFINK